MKKVLFVIPSLGAGGAEKSLVNLLHLLNGEPYEIDVLLFQKAGLFLEQIPKGVHLVSIPGDYKIFTQSLPKALLALLKHGKINQAINRIQYAVALKKEKNPAKAEQLAWKYWAKSMETLPKTYDVAIGYLEKSSIYFVVDKVNARKKIGWIHNDYEKLGQDKGIDYPYFQKINSLVTVSELCVESLNRIFPDLSHKVVLLENIISKKWLIELSKENFDIYDDKMINFLSIGRLTHQKGFDIAIKAFSILPSEILDKIRWYIIGNGEDKEKLELLINESNLSHQIRLVGLRSNPYPWLAKCDIYFQPSRYEGKSIAIDEAKLLQKPILVTRFSTVNDQIEHLKTGYIVEMNEKAIAEGIELLISRPEIRKQLTENLATFSLPEDEILTHFKRLVDE